MTTTARTVEPRTSSTVGKHRWTICALLFVATTINYMDRSVIGVLGPTLQYKVFMWSDQDYAIINMAFKAAYAIGMLVMGAIIDRLGTRIGYTLSIGIWSIFGMLHSLVRPAFSLIGFSIARFGLGFGESGNFPAANKTVAEWFPKKERALAIGLFNAGSNVGAVLAPLVIPLIVWPDGTNWQYAFLTTGVFSALWVVLWLRTYRKPEEDHRLSPGELAYINSDSAKETSTEKLPWKRVFPVRETWAFATAKITDAVWWFYLFWAGKFLFDRFGLDITSLGIPLIVIYVLADGGSVAGGWLSSRFIKRGWTINRSRKTAMLIFALCILPVTFATRVDTRFNIDEQFFSKLKTETFRNEEQKIVDGRETTIRTDELVPAEVQEKLRSLSGKSFESAKEFSKAVAAVITPVSEKKMESALMNSARSDSMYWVSVLLIAIAAASHQAWSANVFSVASDVFPKKAIASVTGIGGMVGAVAGLLADYSLGRVLTESGPSGYFFAFLVAGSLYLVILGFVHLLIPKMTPLDENLKRIPA